MSNETPYTLDLNPEENVINFTRGFRKPRECQHYKIQISLEENELLCTDCNTRLNPIWWIKFYMERINRVSKRNTAILSESREIWAKLDKKRSFMCKHCHEPNDIDFKRLPSKAAIQRGISVIENESPDRVEIND